MLFIPHFENCHAAATSFKMTVKVAWHTASERQWFSTENILFLGGHVAMPGDGTGCHTARTGQREMPLNIPQAQDSPPQQSQPLAALLWGQQSQSTLLLYCSSIENDGGFKLICLFSLSLNRVCYVKIKLVHNHPWVVHRGTAQWIKRVHGMSLFSLIEIAWDIFARILLLILGISFCVLISLSFPPPSFLPPH